ncbi:hypothetical protein D1007_08087 [Hordeum vulgare]|nr:hypothetical protein D1007_08087 [Hordeum vulgare]
MDPATPASDADVYAEANGEAGADDSEFADAQAGAGGEDAGADGPRELPEELARGVVCLECYTSPEAVAAGEGETCRVYVVGTAHVSQESCDQVKAVINFLKPQAVFLELCSSRVTILTPQNLQVPTMNEMIDMWKKKKMNTFGILYSWFLAKLKDMDDVDMLTLVIQEMSSKGTFFGGGSCGKRACLWDKEKLATTNRGTKFNELPVTRKGPSKLKILASIGAV